jgi:hypothetical protein
MTEPQARHEERKAQFAVDLSNYSGMCELAGKPCDANAFNAGWLAHESREGAELESFRNSLKAANKRADRWSLLAQEYGCTECTPTLESLRAALREAWKIIDENSHASLSGRYTIVLSAQQMETIRAALSSVPAPTKEPHL